MRIGIERSDRAACENYEHSNSLVIVALFLTAFALRAVGADYGYFHGDEPINAAARVLSGELSPGQHFYPPLVNYLHAVGFAFLFLIGLILDWWDGVSGFRGQYFDDPTVFYVTARLLTAAIGAMTAPLFYLIARRLGLVPWAALLVGLGGAFFPLSVFMSHIAKGDVALATSFVAVIWAIIARLDTGKPGKWDIWIAVFVVLAVSFKHSSAIILGPLSVGVVALIARSEGVTALTRSLLRFLATIALIWPVLNIGVLLDFASFLEFQRIQSVMSVRMDQGVAPGLITFLQRAQDPILGLNPVHAFIAAVFPAILAIRSCKLRHKPVLLVVWGALVIGSVAIAAMSGTRQPEHLWIANFAGFYCLSFLALMALIVGSAGVQRAAVAVVWAFGFIEIVIGAVIPIQQALAIPVRDLTDAYIAEELADEMILTMVDIGLPQRREAQDMQLARWHRLADRYDVEMPELAEERLIRENEPNSVFYLAMPTVMYGLEGVDEDSVEFEVQPHAWPPQREEWELDYWLDQGFRIFLVSNLEYHVHEIESQLMRTFFEDLVERCSIEAHFDPTKPLFLEREVAILRC
ncbi:ArnT family glycosyltransferase [Nioella aestuarii]|uniref:ArnT family glycosyltransferase n=1 Tax=Nioella aestuarii TaxID=1662864 RepID=UPI003D7F2AB0